MKALVLGAALFLVAARADACSPVDYSDPADRLADAIRYYANAEWIAVGTVSSVKITDADSLWASRVNDDPAVITAGPTRLPGAYVFVHAPFGVEYKFATIRRIKGQVPDQAFVRFVDLLPNDHPREAMADWPDRVATGAHRTFVRCDLSPTFGIGQEILLIKPKRRIYTEYFPGNGGADIASTLDLSSAAFRSLEPTTGTDEWYSAVQVAARLDRGGWPISFAEW